MKYKPFRDNWWSCWLLFSGTRCKRRVWYWIVSWRTSPCSSTVRNSPRPPSVLFHIAQIFLTSAFTVWEERSAWCLGYMRLNVVNIPATLENVFIFSFQSWFIILFFFYLTQTLVVWCLIYLKFTWKLNSFAKLGWWYATKWMTLWRWDPQQKFGVVYYFKSNSVYKMCNLISYIKWSLSITCCMLCKVQSFFFLSMWFCFFQNFNSFCFPSLFIAYFDPTCCFIAVHLNVFVFIGFRYYCGICTTPSLNVFAQLLHCGPSISVFSAKIFHFSYNYKIRCAVITVTSVVSLHSVAELLFEISSMLLWRSCILKHFLPLNWGGQSGLKCAKSVNIALSFQIFIFVYCLVKILIHKGSLQLAKVQINEISKVNVAFFMPLQRSEGCKAQCCTALCLIIWVNTT